MARTTETLVRATLNRDYDSANNPDLTTYIDWAGAVTDDVSACAVSKSKTLNAARLELIERFLAAHAYAMSDRTYHQKKTMSASAVFDGTTKMYLEATTYGQQAVTLDPTGCLAAIASGIRKKASGAWLGYPPSEQVDYTDRS